MVRLWSLLLFHPAYALISVTTVELGEPVTFTCFFPDAEYLNTRVRWYKQSAGDTLRLITLLMKSTLKPTFEPGFSSSLFNVSHSTTQSTLTIFKTVQADEAMYHCAVTTWSKEQWNGSYLGFKGNNERTSNYSVVQASTVSDPVRPGDSVTLRCSFFSDSNKTCPGGHSVYWFRTGSDGSHPDIIYTDVNDECEQGSDSVKSCVYNFSKNVSVSDAGTYHCAVATCGRILFGDGTKLNIEAFNIFHIDVILPVLCAFLVIIGVSVAVFLHAIMGNRCDCCNDNFASGNLKGETDTCIYSAAVFTVMKTGGDVVRDPKAGHRERNCVAIKAVGLNKQVGY